MVTTSNEQFDYQYFQRHCIFFLFFFLLSETIQLSVPFRDQVYKVTLKASIQISRSFHWFFEYFQFLDLPFYVRKIAKSGKP